jgi:DNA-binding response OmpR family regulator
MWSRKVRILHVEDDPSFQAIVRVAFAQLAGHVVETASDGHAALALAAGRPPDLVILDLEMPGMDGVQTLRALRALDGMAGVPVIFLTASSDMLKAVEMLAAGAVTVLQKPCRPRRLLEAVVAALEGASPTRKPGDGAP